MSNLPSLHLQRLTAMALQALALLLFGLHLYVYLFLPPAPPNTVPDQLSLETAWWGVWPVHSLAPWQVVLGGLAVLGAVVIAWLPPGRGQGAPAAGGRRLLVLVTAVLVVAFYLFPLAHTRWGDAFVLANGIAYPDAALRITHSWQAPLDVFLHSQVWSLLHGPLGWEDAAPAYRLLSPLAGLLYLLAALALSDDLRREPRAVPAWLTYGLLATLGLMQLFFGYIENYSFAAAGVLAYLWLGLRVLAGRRALWQAATLLAVLNATHPSTIILAPSLLFLGWRCFAGGQAKTPALQGRNKTLLRVVGEMALPMLLIGGATFVWMEASGHGLHTLLNTDRPGGGDARWFVPLWETSTRWERYTLFSWPHLRDWLNGQLLVAPVVLPGLAIVAASLWAARRQAVQERGDVRVSVSAGSVGFLLVAAGFYLLFTFVWNPDYGGQRDWDLFSLAALPATLMLALLLPRALPDSRWLRAGAIPLLALQGWHTWAWIVQNTQPWHWPD
jgi:hypothetical protein